MSTDIPHYPAPPDLKAALCMIGDWANRDKLTPAEVIEIFTDGFMQRHAHVEGHLALVSTEATGQGVANV